MTVYLTVDDVLTIHTRDVGPDLLGDFGLLESAVLRPQTTIGGYDAYPDVHAKAAALLHSLARNHAFFDGNKRIAVAAAAVFYMLNGYRLVVDAGELVALAIDTAEGIADVQSIAGRLKNWVTPLDIPDEF